MENNDQKLFELLYVPLVSFIEEIIDDHENAKAIAAEVFSQHNAELKGYDSVGDLTELIRFLQKKAKTKSLRFLRVKKERPEAELAMYADFEESVDHTLIAKEWDQMMKIAEARLSTEERTAWQLYLSGINAKDAARIMGIADPTYRNFKHKAIKKYKRALKAGGFLIIVILLAIAANAR